MDTLKSLQVKCPGSIYLNATGRKGGRESETEKDRERERDRQTDRDRDREKEQDKEKERDRDRETQFMTVDRTLAACGSSSIFLNSIAGKETKFLTSLPTHPHVHVHGTYTYFRA